MCGKHASLGNTYPCDTRSIFSKNFGPGRTNFFEKNGPDLKILVQVPVCLAALKKTTLTIASYPRAEVHDLK